jgi:Protein of unknown function (DUF551)
MWQPIETAPKDGKSFLACYGHQGNVMRIVHWMGLYGVWMSQGDVLHGFSTNATHWMPLPEPPK